MAQAFAKIYGNGKVMGFSAGSKPSGRINPKAVVAMRELNYDLGNHQSKSLAEVQSEAPFDIVVTMGCGDACPWMPAKRHIDWQIEDPRDMDELQFNMVRDKIGQMVKNLLEEILSP